MSCKRATAPLSAVAAIFSVMVLCVGTLSAQVTLTGKIVDQESIPLTGVIIATGQPGIFAISQDSGRFSLEGLAPGVHPLTLRWIGVEPQEFRLSIPERISGEFDVGEIVFRQEPLRLEDIVVQEQAPSMYPGDLEDFERMRRMGFGFFFTAEDLAAMRVGSASQITHRVGGMPRYDPLEGNTIEFYALGRRCTAQISINGIPSQIRDLDFVAPLDRIGGMAITGCKIHVWTKPIAPEDETRFRFALSLSHAARDVRQDGWLVVGALIFPIARGALQLNPSITVNTSSGTDAIRWGFQVAVRRELAQRPFVWYAGAGMGVEKRTNTDTDIVPKASIMTGIGKDIGFIRPFAEIRATQPFSSFDGYLEASFGLAVRNW
ncbi:MAG: carboxypeptidase-like regulatory domain-containing protein [Gemmatimonadota bacterium]|nr:carboxypeptidase-like regulatory domain-containing protein [Gemmatimonadota bacterium]